MRLRKFTVHINEAKILALIDQVAARNCRKRKIDQIKQLETDVQRIRCRKTELITEHEKLVAQRNHWADLVKRLHDHVLKVNIFIPSHV